jgi:hypothetical protein
MCLDEIVERQRHRDGLLPHVLENDAARLTGRGHLLRRERWRRGR